MYIKVRVIARAKKELITEMASDHFKISVKEPAEQNRANRRIVTLFQDKYPGKSVRIINGHHSHSKIISVKM